MPQPYADAEMSALREARVEVATAARRVHPDSNAYTQSFTRERTIHDSFRRYQADTIRYFVQRRYGADEVRLKVLADGVTVVATFTKGW